MQDGVDCVELVQRRIRLFPPASCESEAVGGISLPDVKTRVCAK
ncbi:hypothetical protein HMPREF0591_4492 [Mycobacterium parascrofulaceum ATCC BAA-614]|uniref:Uncharacterized protein n=1 Tax=Mycobacterium parascrofulaceum ATCC BAA-614 TaxID=525368 RepID=D5PE98_9MYCO|nr:hypothetical protein HMPREF0591_4492 [Mycobacterium parascrofulaceum ATCC BAA-614]ETZ60107.1 hypothetical protein L841_4333 [Mycobacterium sp. MAC_080597_8934]ETZ60128.1 hypothetical protein L841_4328 [Mycobacterium sp. MAC_080597_8934]